ncbi:MAG: HEAT repeat domain-containing protein, partial [Phycisphaerae bacterium]
MNLPLRVFLAMALTTWQANRAAGRPNLPAPTTRPAASPTSSSEATDADAPPGQPPVPAAQDLDDHVRLITDPNTPEARELGARKLLEAGSEAAARRLASILQSSSDPAAKQAVCRAIGRARSPMPALVEPLVQLLGTDPAALDTLIVAALRQFDRRAVIPRLEASAIETARPIQRRGSAIRALGDMGDDLSAVAALVRLLGDGEARIRRAVLEALEDATGVRHRDAAAALAWWESHESMTPLQWLREVNQRRAVETSRLYEQVAELTDRLVTAYREAYLRVPEAERLGKLLEFLGDPAPAVRGLGLDLINALITDRKDVGKEIKARLVEMIADPDPVIRRKVAVMAGDLRLTEAAARLQAAVSRETDARVRSAQVGALGRIDEIGAIPVLLARLSDESKEVVMEAATALGLLARRGHLEAPAVAPIASALLERFGALGPSDEEVSGRFLEAMGRIGAEAFRPVFRREIRSGHSLRLRAAAIAGLASFGDAEAAGEVR